MDIFFPDPNAVSRKLSLRDLRLILAVTEYGSMSRTAQALGISQAAVSQVISGAEANLGVRLFDRSQRGVQLTEYGQVLTLRARAAFDELASGLLELEGLQSKGTGVIRIGAPETIAASVLPMLLDQFNQRWPDVRIEVIGLIGEQAEEYLQKRKVDLVFMRGSDSLDAMLETGHYDLTTLFADELKIVVGSQSQWADLGKDDLAALASAPWIALPYGWGEAALPKAFAQAGLPAPHYAIQTFSVHLRLQLVATGRFVTALPKSILQAYRHSFPILSLPIVVPNRSYEVVMLTVKERTLRRVVEQFILETQALFSPKS